jgi:hypothetical protein
MFASEQNLHMLFVDYCDRNKIGNAVLNTTNEYGIITEKGVKRFRNATELYEELVR